MNRLWIQRVIPRAFAWAAVIALGGVFAVAQNAAPAGQRTDGQIEMDVVHALDAQTSLQNDLITAATVQGKVTLSGTVSSEASRELAERVVKGVPGVAEVQNNLKIGNPSDDPNAQAGGTSDALQQDMADNGPPNSAGEPSNPPQWDQGQNQQESGQTSQADNGQNAPDWGPAGPPPGYGQDQGQNQGQDQQQASGQNAPDWGPAGPPPGYGQDQGQQGYGQQPPPGYGPGPAYGQNQYPPYGQQGRPQYGPQYGPEPQQRPNYQIATNPVTLPQGTLIQVRTSEPVNSKRATPGSPIQFTVIQDVTLGGVLAIPRGATVHGVVTEVKHNGSGTVAGSDELALRLTSLDLGGRNYPLESDLFKVRGPNKAGRTVGNALGGALIGAIIGGAAGGGSGAAIGAVAGGTVGTAATAATSGPGVWIPAEALVSFHLAQPITVHPVTQEEADRLAQGLYQGGPRLYRRPPPYRFYGGYGYPGYGYPGAYPYWGGPVYYRPYVYMGGFYYWR